MKKLVTILFVVSIISAASAEDTKMNVGVSGVVYGTTYRTVLKATETENDGGDFAEGRIQPILTITNGTLDAVLKLRIDHSFGRDDHAGNNPAYPQSNDTDSFSSGSRNTNIKVINAYVKSQVDALPGLTFAGGIMSYDFPLIYSDNMAMLNASYEIPLGKLSLYYGKTSEGDKNSSTDDAQVYIADLTVKYGESFIRPAFFAYKKEANASENSVDQFDSLAYFNNGKGFLYGLEAGFVYSSFGIDASAAYARGKNKENDETVRMSGYAFDVSPYYKIIEWVKLSLFMTMVSGDKGSDAKKDKSFLDSAIDPASGLNVSRLYILEDGATFAKSSNVCDAAGLKYNNNDGYSAYGIALDIVYGPVTGILQAAYARANKVADNQKKSLGIEIDSNIGYALTKNSTLFVEGGYLKTGKYFSGTDADPIRTNKAFYVMGGISYSM